MGRQPELRRAPTIRDVAVDAGVSPATAARALGGYGRVSSATRKRVQAAAERLSYRPNTLARSMITGTTHSIGVVVADIENPYFARAVRGIADVAHDAGMEVILVNSDEDAAKELAAIKVLLQKKVDGLIVAPASPKSARHIADVAKSGVPVVLFDRGASGVPADTVVVDNEQASLSAMNHLIGLGHRRIAVLLAAKSAMPAADLAVARPGPAGMTTTLRLAGWASALCAAGLPVSDDMIRGCHAYDRESAAQQAIAALELDDPATALFATDSLMTLGAVDGIAALGREMPRDVSLVAFDDPDWTTLVRPPLTVIAQPVYELGRRSTRLLLSRLSGEAGPPETVVLQTTFVLRGSTGPVPGVRHPETHSGAGPK